MSQGDCEQADARRSLRIPVAGFHGPQAQKGMKRLYLDTRREKAGSVGPHNQADLAAPSLAAQ